MDLYPADIALFDSMEGNYVSENERIFFETLKERQQHDWSVAHDFLLNLEEGEECVFLIRINAHEYMFGCDDLKGRKVYEHVMTLSEALYTNLGEIGAID